MAITVNATAITFNNGSTQTVAATGTVSSVATSGGIKGGTITTTGTVSLDLYTGTTFNNTTFPIGTVIGTFRGPTQNMNATSTIYVGSAGCTQPNYASTNIWAPGYVSALAGTWNNRGRVVNNACADFANIFQRTA